MNQKNEKKRRWDSILIQKGYKCDLDQYEMLKRCSDKKDTTEWNQWRKQHPDIDIYLEGKSFNNFWLENVNFIGETVCGQADGTEINFKGTVNLRKANFERAHLQNAIFGKAHLEESFFDSAKVKGADFHSSHLDNAELGVAHFENCDFSDAIILNSYFVASNLIGAKFLNSSLNNTVFRFVIVDSTTLINTTEEKINRNTDFTGVNLDNCRIDPSIKQLLEHNISTKKQLLEYKLRRKNWEVWYKDENEPIRQGKFIFSNEKVRLKTNQVLRWLVRKFWEISDYGISTPQIIKTFLQLAIIFAAIYLGCGLIDFYLLDIKDSPGIVSNLFMIEDTNKSVSPFLVPLRAVYFSIVTMTTLGFGDMYASTHGFLRGLIGHILLSIQVILGYVLLGALVTRFAVLFTAGGPAGKFEDEKKKETE